MLSKHVPVESGDVIRQIPGAKPADVYYHLSIMRQAGQIVMDHAGGAAENKLAAA